MKLRRNRKTLTVASVSAAVEEKAEERQVENPAEDEEEDDRGSWGNQCEFILSCLGFAIGFGNVWRFPYLCYKNGGAVFLIPYLTMLVFAGLPMFFLELALGQYVALGPTSLYPQLSPLFGGLGIAMPIISYYVSVYFDIIMAWSFYYIFYSFTSELPWGTCDNDFNTAQCASVFDIQGCRDNNVTINYYNGTCLSTKDMCAVAGLDMYNETYCGTADNLVSPSVAVGRVSSAEEFYENGMLGVNEATWEEFGSLQWKLLGCVALGWILSGFGLVKGIKSTGKAVYFTSLFPYVVMTILLCFGLTLDGAHEGIEFYFLNVNTTKLAEVEVWQDAASQLFFSLGTSFGSLITLASYNKFSTNCMRDAMMISCLNCATSVYAGFVLFSILGSLAYELGVPVSEVVSSGSGLAFIAYPQAVLSMPPPQLWSILFFSMFVSIGLSSQFAMVETVNTAIYDRWPSLRQRKPLVVFCVCFSMFLLGLPMCFQGGMYLFELYNVYSAGLSVIVIAIVEVIVVNYIYGNSKFMHHIEKEMGIHVPVPLRLFWQITWMFITPVSLLFILVMSLISWAPAVYGDYVLPESAQAVGWVLCVTSVVFIPLYAIYVFFKSEHKGAALVRATPDMCPAKERNRRKKMNAQNFVYANPTFAPDTLERQTSGSSKPSAPPAVEEESSVAVSNF